MYKTLVVMAAGLGSRYGGIKQIEPVGPNGEILMEYSIYDAIKSGFDRVIFIINRKIGEEFKSTIGNKISKYVKVEYVYQEKYDVNYFYSMKRSKPLGTGHAVLRCDPLIEEGESFVTINADDFYGREAFELAYKALHNKGLSNISYKLGNCLSDNGKVTRGVCKLNSAGDKLKSIMEVKSIYKNENNKICSDEIDCLELRDDTVVSMNMWVLNKKFLYLLDIEMKRFVEKLLKSDDESELILPVVIGDYLPYIDVDVIRCNEEWFGVTYKEDKNKVMLKIKELICKGRYPFKLFE